MADMPVIDPVLATSWREKNSRIAEIQQRLKDLDAAKTDIETQTAAALAELATVSLEQRAVREEALQAFFIALDAASVVAVPAEVPVAEG